MKKFSLLFVLLLVTLNICCQEIEEKDYPNFQAFLTDQNLKISKIKNGLSKLLVNEIIGPSIIVKVPKVGRMKPLKKLFKQPIYLNEYKSNPKKVISINWYFTTPKDQDGIISKKECIPVIFENDSVVGLGWDFFNSYRRSNVLR